MVKNEVPLPILFTSINSDEDVDISVPVTIDPLINSLPLTHMSITSIPKHGTHAHMLCGYMYV